MDKLLSPAKINLYLHVVQKRSDGYHDIDSHFQVINLFDILEFEWPESGSDHLFCNDPCLSTDDSNLVNRAINLFKSKTGWKDPVSIRLYKNIPTQSGLGGGSSNAATTLWALNERAGFPVSISQLQSWSAEIGSDVPFFFSLGTARCQGRGEIVTPLPALPSSEEFWIVKPQFGLSTPAVFKNLKIVSKLDPEKLYLHNQNDLETPAFELSPALLSLKQLLKSAGFDSVFMSGSGSALVCRGNAKLPVLPEGTKIFKVRNLNRSVSTWYGHETSLKEVFI